MTTKRYVGMARISMEERRKLNKSTTGHSIDTQVDIVKRTGQALGYTLQEHLGASFIVKTRQNTEGKRYPGMYCDDGGPGWAMGAQLRPALSKLLDDAQSGLFDAIIVPYQDRISRVSVDTKKLYRAFKALGVELVLEGRVIQEQDVFILGVKGEIYEEIIRGIRKKTQDTLDRLRADGVKVGRAPIGLQRTIDGKGFELTDYAKKIVSDYDNSVPVEVIVSSLEPICTTDGTRKLTMNGVYRVLRNVKWLRDGTLKEKMASLDGPRKRKVDDYETMRHVDRVSFEKRLNEIAPGVMFEFR